MCVALACDLEFEEALGTLRIREGVNYVRLDTTSWNIPKIRVGLKLAFIHLIPTFPVTVYHGQYGNVPVVIVYEL